LRHICNHDGLPETTKERSIELYYQLPLDRTGMSPHEPRRQSNTCATSNAITIAPSTSDKISMRSTASLKFYCAQFASCTAQRCTLESHQHFVVVYVYCASRYHKPFVHDSRFLGAMTKRIRRHHPFWCQTSRPASDSCSDFAPPLNFNISSKSSLPLPISSCHLTNDEEQVVTQALIAVHPANALVLTRLDPTKALG
jgi:hypothetical protein